MMPRPNQAAIVAAAVVLSCGSAAAAGSPFEGRWAGPWVSRQQHLTGTFAFEVDANGAFSGTTDYKDNHGTISGRIDPAGHLEATYKYGVVPYRAKGQLRLEGDHLRGTTYYSLPVGVPFDYGPIDLTRR